MSSDSFPKMPSSAEHVADPLPWQSNPVSREGVDMTQIRALLALSPTERVHALVGIVNRLKQLRSRVRRSAADHTYEELEPDAIFFDIEGIRTPVLALPRIIDLKEAAGRPKDIAALPILRAVLEDKE